MLTHLVHRDQLGMVQIHPWVTLLVVLPHQYQVLVNSPWPKIWVGPVRPAALSCHLMCLVRTFLLQLWVYATNVSLCTVYLLILITAEPLMVIADPMDLVFSPNRKTIKLTAQHHLVWLVIKESFEILHLLLLSTHAYLDGVMAIAFVKDALLCAVLNFTPSAAPMYKWIKNKREYFCAILSLVSPTNVHNHSTWSYMQPCIWISTLQSNIKEQCCKLVVPTIDEIGGPTDIAHFVRSNLLISHIPALEQWG